MCPTRPGQSPRLKEIRGTCEECTPDPISGQYPRDCNWQTIAHCYEEGCQTIPVNDCGGASQTDTAAEQQPLRAGAETAGLGASPATYGMQLSAHAGSTSLMAHSILSPTRMEPALSYKGWGHTCACQTHHWLHESGHRCGCDAPVNDMSSPTRSVGTQRAIESWPSPIPTASRLGLATVPLNGSQGSMTYALGNHGVSTTPLASSVKPGECGTIAGGRKQCPCEDEEKACRRCIDQARSQPTPVARRIASQQCLVRGPCATYLQCRYAYMSSMAAEEMADFLRRCPPFEWDMEPLREPKCCVGWGCRKIHGPVLFLHCYLVKRGCDGKRTVFELNPTRPIPETGDVVEQLGEILWAVYGEKFYGDRGVLERCWPCKREDKDGRIGWTNPEECDCITGMKVRKEYPFPRNEQYRYSGPNSNTFASFWAARCRLREGRQYPEMPELLYPGWNYRW
jgi:hypothetical protein